MSAKYFSGTLTNPSTTPANDFRVAFYDAIQQAITAGLTNWAPVASAHNYVSSTGTSQIIRDVYTNSLGFCFALFNATGTNTATNDIRIVHAESYNSTTHVFTNVGHYNVGSSVATSTGYNASTLTVTSAPNNALLSSTTPTQSQWAMFATNDYLYFSVYDANASGKAISFFVGKFNNLIANPAVLTAGEHPKPFGAWFIHSKTSSAGGPLMSLGNGSLNTIHGAILKGNWHISNSPADLSKRDAYSNISNTKTVLTPLYITRGNTNNAPSTSSANGWLIGSLPNSLYSRTTNLNWGDTILVDGKKYQFIGGVNSNTSNYSNDLPCWVEREL